MGKRSDVVLAALLLIMSVALGIRAVRDRRAIRRSNETEPLGLHMGFVAVGPGHKEIQVLPTKLCKVSILFTIRPGALDEQVDWWNQAFARVDPRMAGCSYGICAANDCMPHHSVPSFHLLESVAYRPATEFARLADANKFLVQDGRWTRSWAFGVPKSPELVRADVAKTGL